VILIGGDPGIGKSTLLLQVLSTLAKQTKALYVTGEESLQQVALRAKRLHLPAQDLDLLAEIQVEKILKTAKDKQPKILVIDSIQTICTDTITSAPGSVSQLRESSSQLVRFAKATGTTIFLVGHVTKEGAIAGPRVLEHMVDTVLYFEGERGSRFRVIRAVKNRFGAVNELGVFAMTEKGLKEVSNPSAIFMTQGEQAGAGSVITAAWEGSRPMLVEVQSLVDESHLGNPRRVTVGLETNRLAMLLAVLNRHASIPTHDQDVFVNVVGGMRVLETSADLASLVAIVASLRDRVLPRDLLVFGEVGLGGEIRPVPNGQERLREAAKHGFTRAIVPKANMPAKPIVGMQVDGVSRLDEALGLL
jgi:DNA repair protein RadA/Sms